MCSSRQLVATGIVVWVEKDKRKKNYLGVLRHGVSFEDYAVGWWLALVDEQMMDGRCAKLQRFWWSSKRGNENCWLLLKHSNLRASSKKTNNAFGLHIKIELSHCLRGLLLDILCKIFVYYGLASMASAELMVVVFQILYHLITTQFFLLLFFHSLFSDVVSIWLWLQKLNLK